MNDWPAQADATVSSKISEVIFLARTSIAVERWSARSILIVIALGPQSQIIGATSQLLRTGKTPRSAYFIEQGTGVLCCTAPLCCLSLD